MEYDSCATAAIREITVEGKRKRTKQETANTKQESKKRKDVRGAIKRVGERVEARKPETYDVEL